MDEVEGIRREARWPAPRPFGSTCSCGPQVNIWPGLVLRAQAQAGPHEYRGPLKLVSHLFSGTSTDPFDRARSLDLNASPVIVCNYVNFYAYDWSGSVAQMGSSGAPGGARSGQARTPEAGDHGNARTHARAVATCRSITREIGSW